MILQCSPPFSVISDWCKENDIDQSFEMLPSTELNQLLRRFYGNVRKADGTKYSKSSLNNLRAGIQRHLQAPPFSRSMNIIVDTEFTTANNLFRAGLKRQKRKGEDTSQEYPVITDGDLTKLHASGVMNKESPEGLLNLVWFNVQYKFCRRGREGQRNLKSGDFVFKTDDTGREFVTLRYNDAQKNHQGDQKKDAREQKPVMYGNGSADCPVAALKLYLSKLNPKCSAFYQQPRRKNWQASDPVWYNNCPLGVNTLGDMMKKMSKSAGLSQIYTNHSIRATVCTILNEQDVFSDRTICSLTGHKNTQSLKHYCKASAKQKRDMSDVLQEAVGMSGRGSVQPLAPRTLSRPPDDHAELDSRPSTPAPVMFRQIQLQPLPAPPQTPSPTPVTPRPGLPLQVGPVTVYRHPGFRPNYLVTTPRTPTPVSISSTPTHQFVPAPRPVAVTNVPTHQFVPAPRPVAVTNVPAHQFVPAPRPVAVTRAPTHQYVHAPRPVATTCCAAPSQAAAPPTFVNCNMANASFNLYINY